MVGSAACNTPKDNHKYVNPWSRVLLEKLMVSKPAKVFSAFYGTRKFITAFTSVSHISVY